MAAPGKVEMDESGNGDRMLLQKMKAQQKKMPCHWRRLVARGTASKCSLRT
jgi:hypothetical protein